MIQILDNHGAVSKSAFGYLWITFFAVLTERLVGFWRTFDQFLENFGPVFGELLLSF